MTLILSGSAVVALLVLIRSSRSLRAHWDLSSWFILIMAWLFVAPNVLGALLGGRTTALDELSNPILLLAPWVVHVQRLSNYLLAVVPIVFALRAAGRRKAVGAVNEVGLLALALFAVAALSSYGAGTGLLTKPAVTLLAALVAVPFLPRGPGAAAGAALFGMTFAAAGGLLTLFSYNTTAVPCSGAYKCGPLGVFVLGALESENAFGLVLCATLPFLWLTLVGKARLFLVLYIGLMIYACSARTSALAALVIIVVLVVLRPTWDRTQPRDRLTLLVTGAGLAAGVVAGALLPYVTNDESAYTYRGLVWLTARRYLHGHTVIGLGSPSWSGLVQQGALPEYATYSTHNQWLDVFWIAGGLGLLLFSVLLLRMLVNDYPIAVAVLLPMVFAGLTERIWGIGAFDVWSFAYLAGLMCVRPRLRRPIPSPHQRWNSRAPVTSPSATSRTVLSKSWWAPGLAP